MIGVINYGAGNLGSVMNALGRIGVKAYFVNEPDELVPGKSPYEKIIFPGDGHFATAMKALQNTGYENVIREWIYADKPFLGICIGLQLLFECSEEAPPEAGRPVQGLSVLKGNVRLFPGVKVPQIGWNRTVPSSKSRLFAGLGGAQFFYYIHSYYVIPDNAEDSVATADYSVEFCAAVERSALCAVQFHPEKSGAPGLKLLENWAIGSS
ncbi:MAG: imidazole glycerol phosphate synthase subunit HisH [Spirochaetaceae bacterium]|jgi:imidazole glycerol phosphate synthase glutamine amidotransferase subunit|nr:imidazole glycerol phosphate synthase subunit HisH [Spirochaetaceae bacterium]